jgi:hypothetical protein
MKKCAKTAIDRAASAAAIVPGPTLAVGIVKRVATKRISLFGRRKQVPERGIVRI